MLHIFEKYLSVLSEYFITSIYHFSLGEIQNLAKSMTGHVSHPQREFQRQASFSWMCLHRTRLVSCLLSVKQLGSTQATLVYPLCKRRVSPSLGQCQRGREEPRLRKWQCLPCRSQNTHMRSRSWANPKHDLKSWIPLQAREAIRNTGEKVGLFPVCSGLAHQLWHWLPNMLKCKPSPSGMDNTGFTGMLNSAFKTKQNLI